MPEPDIDRLLERGNVVSSTLMESRPEIKDDVRNALNYLRHFRYTPAALEGLESAQDPATEMRESLREFQREQSLPVTGQLDEATLETIQLPRCGVTQDVQNLGTGLPRWKLGEPILYHIEKFLTAMTEDEQRSLIKQAWQRWETVCNIKVSEAPSAAAADILISCGSGSGDDFDNPQVLAWANLPNEEDYQSPPKSQLRMKFDSRRDFVAGGSRGTLYLNVAAHEFGHLLGLDHIKTDRSALMAPIYSRDNHTPGASDIRDVQNLYGARNGPPRPPPPSEGWNPSLGEKTEVEFMLPPGVPQELPIENAGGTYDFVVTPPEFTMLKLMEGNVRIAFAMEEPMSVELDSSKKYRLVITLNVGMEKLTVTAEKK